VHDRVQPLARGCVLEHQRAERRAVERAALQHPGAEGRRDLGERGAAGRDDVARGLVEVERRAAA
jgi:hypothetical protein